MHTIILASAATFSLICSGTVSTESQGEVVEEELTKAIYQIDLDANRWCVDRCPTVLPIFENTDLTLNLFRKSDQKSVHILNINRKSGSWYSIYIDNDIKVVFETKGKCEKAPFEGFPKMKF